MKFNSELFFFVFNRKVNSLVDSVLSLTISEQIKNERRPLSTKKIEALRKVTLGSRNVNFIKPMRPDRKGLNSEVIIEKKLASGTKIDSASSFIYVIKAYFNHLISLH